MRDALDALCRSSQRLRLPPGRMLRRAPVLRVRQVRVRDLADFAAVADQMVAGSLDWSDLRRVVARCLHRPWLARFLSKRQLLAVFAHSAPPARTETPAQPTSAASAPAVDAWARAVQRLVSAGHTREDVLAMTLLEVEQYLAAVDALDRARLAGDTTSRRVAAHADAKGWAEYMKAVEHGK